MAGKGGFMKQALHGTLARVVLRNRRCTERQEGRFCETGIAGNARKGGFAKQALHGTLARVCGWALCGGVLVPFTQAVMSTRHE